MKGCFAETEYKSYNSPCVGAVDGLSTVSKAASLSKLIYQSNHDSVTVTLARNMRIERQLLSLLRE
jgi:hypothetical protein